MSLTPDNRSKKRIAVAIVLGTMAFVALICVYHYFASMPLLTPGNRPSVYITLDHYTIQTIPGQQNPSNLTIWFNSTGRDTAVLTSISVQGVSFPLSVSIPSDTIGVVKVDTSTSGFYFMSGHSYSLAVETTTSEFGHTIDYQ